ncbi:hypothetical protein CGCA056_v003619 [Colletotrichum aenigma]|uniref:uncharacterized protein n=1 Tax=Colletotrichum aenigma TaxID=1215731 RepID=UPI001872F1E7|nr:uncharacterized protein CGCA056_v003619 [Colletotrichum aenigma]KAF5525284.1 hypothetical protein CGCA056_v003619 [Colletotrichum aenigma]
MEAARDSVTTELEGLRSTVASVEVMRNSAIAEVDQRREELSSSQKDVSKERLEVQGLTTVLNGLKTAVEAIKARPNGTGSAESDWQKAVELLASRLNAFNIFDDGRYLTHSSVIHEVGMAIVRDAEFDKLRRFVATMEVNATYCFWQVVEAEEGDEIIRLENSKATCPLHTMEERLSKSDKCLRFKCIVRNGDRQLIVGRKTKRTTAVQQYDLDMVSRHRVDRDELAAHIEANNRAANLLRASFNDPSIRTFSSGFTGGPSAPPQTPQPRWLDNMCFTRFSAQSDPPPPQQQQQTTGYHAAARRESVSAPRHDFHDRDCGDRPRRDALPDVGKRKMTGTPVAANKKQKMSTENGTSAFQAALVSEGADGALDSESTADGAVGTGGVAQDAGLDEEDVQTPAEPTPTWGSSKTFLEATVDEAMDQGK